jgi:hypothetical protein
MRPGRGTDARQRRSDPGPASPKREQPRGNLAESQNRANAAKTKGASLATPMERLLRMRGQAIARALQQGPGGYQVAVIDAALAALDETPADAEPAGRAVVSDYGQIIRLTLYLEDGEAALVELSPAAAVALAGELIGAALPRLNGE